MAKKAFSIDVYRMEDVPQWVREQVPMTLRVTVVAKYVVVASKEAPWQIEKVVAQSMGREVVASWDDHRGTIAFVL